MLNVRLFSRFAFISAFAALAIAGGCLQGPVDENTDSEVSDETLTIGIIQPLTGGAEAYGATVRNVLDLLAEKTNEAGGVNGMQVKLKYEDGQCSAKPAQAAAEKLVTVDKVSFIIGGTCSSETLAAAPVTEKAGVILISSGSSSPEIRDAGDFVFRTYPSDTGKGTVLGAYAAENFDLIGVLTEQTDYAVALGNVFTEVAKAAGKEVISEAFTSDSSDFRTQLTKLKNAGVEALLINPQTPDKAVVIFNQLRELDWKPQLITQEVVATDAELMAAEKDYVEGMIAADVVPPEGTLLTQFVEAYSTKYGSEPNFLAISSATVDAWKVLMSAIKSVGADPVAVRDALYNVKNFPGVNGNFGFDKYGEPSLEPSLLVLRNGKAVPVGSNADVAMEATEETEGKETNEE